MPQLLKKFWFLLFLIPIFVWMSWHIFYLALSENLEVKKDSMDYFLTVRFSTLQNFPLVGKIGDEKYYSGCGDGAKLPHVAVRYKSYADKNLIIKTFENYLFENRFIKNEKLSNANEFFYDKDDSKTIYIYIYPFEENYFVEVIEFYQ